MIHAFPPPVGGASPAGRGHRTQIAEPGDYPAADGHLPPVAKVSATPVAGGAPLPVQFTGSHSYDPDGVGMTFAWTFSDGSTSTEANPRHIYTAAGTYAAQLTVTDALGLRDQKTASIKVTSLSPVAVINASPKTGTAPLQVFFNGSGFSYDPDGLIVSYSWDFGDGMRASESDLLHTYTAVGTYTARLTVTDAAGHTGQDSVIITVTGSTGTGNRLLVGDIAMSVNKTSSGSQCTAKIKVKNASGAVVKDASAAMRWSGVTSSTATKKTDSKGLATFTNTRTSKKGTCTATVTGVSKSGFTYDPLQNVETSDSLTY